MTKTKTVKIIRHVDCEGPGYLLTVLERNQLPFELVKVDEGEAIPESLDDTLALVSMGGGMSVNDDLPWIEKECELIRAADAEGIPVLGHCLGAQLIAKALGAEVFANTVKEIGWFEVFPVKESVLFSGVEFPLSVFHWHGETFSLPNGASTVLSSEYCENQCFTKDNMIGFQCHIEMTEPLIREWVQRFSEQLESPVSTVQSSQLILQNLVNRVATLNKAADKIYQHWIDEFLRG